MDVRSCPLPPRLQFHGGLKGRGFIPTDDAEKSRCAGAGVCVGVQSNRIIRLHAQTAQITNLKNNKMDKAVAPPAGHPLSLQLNVQL